MLHNQVTLRPGGKPFPSASSAGLLSLRCVKFNKMTYRSRLHVLSLAIVALATVVFFAACNKSEEKSADLTPKQPDGTPPTDSAPTTAVVPPSKVRRHLAQVAVVTAGAPSELVDDAWHEIADETRVSTDAHGEGVLKLSGCLDIYLFQASGLVKAPCPRSALKSRNILCALRGTSAIYNSCAEKVVIETASAEIELQGTWLSVTYLPERQASVIALFDGRAPVRPVLNSAERTLGEPSEVAAGQFWFSAPDGISQPVAGLAARQSHPLERFPAVIQELRLEPWIDRIRQRAKADKISFPELPSGPPDLVITALEITGDPVESAGGVELPVRVVVKNQGGSPAGIFKVSLEYAGSRGSLHAPFTVPGKQNASYPYTTEPLVAGGELIFEGRVRLPVVPQRRPSGGGIVGALEGLAAPALPAGRLKAIADSCAGDEIFTNFCRVQEKDERNNEKVIGLAPEGAGTAR
ncbi:MAG: hypothetical protein ACR2L2_05095 [Acidobacteriota bacterium]